MIRSSRSRVIAALAVGALATMGAIAPATAQSSSAGQSPAASASVPSIPDTPTALEFLYSPFTDYAPFFIAEDKGYFDDYGLDVTLADKSGTAETIQLLSTGQSQAGGSTWGASFFNSIPLGATVAVVAQLAKINPDPDAKSPVPLIVSKARYDSGELTTVADLAPAADGTKKKIGIPSPGGFGEYSVYLALKDGGLTMDQVELVDVPPPLAAEGLQNGSFDAAWTIEPFATTWANDGLTASISDDHARGVELGFLAFNDEWLEAHQDAAIRFTAAYLKAAQELDGGGWADPEIQQIVAKWTGLEPDFLSQIGLTIRSEDGSLDEASIRDQEAYFRSADELTYEGEVDLDSVYHRDILAAAHSFLEANP